MPKFVIINDLHVSARAPASRIDDFTSTIFSKLDQVLALAIKVEAAAILVAGDVFNEKTRVPIIIIHRVLSWCQRAKDAGIRVIGIPGNHDLLNDRYESLPGQAIGLLFSFGAMEDASYRSITVGGVGISGIPYPAAKLLDNWSDIPTSSCPVNVIMGHCFATVEGGDYFGEPILRYSDLLQLPFNVFIFGHDHRDNGVVSLGGKFFINIGALARGSLSQENVNRDVKCALLSTSGSDDITVQQVRLNFKPANEVFDLALRAQKQREHNAIEEFVGSLSKDLLNIGKISFKERLDQMTVSDEVRRKVLTYIEAAESSE